MYGAIAVGFFAAVFGGAPSQVSGPTAPMAVAMAVIVTNYASNLPEALAVVVLGGLLQMALGLLRAVILLGLLLGLGRYAEPIPLAALAGVLIKVGWDIIDWRLMTRIHRIRRDHLVVMLMTLGLTVFIDLVTAVAIGLIAAGIAHARQLKRLELDSVVSIPILDRTFFAGEQGMEITDPLLARVGMVALRGTFTVASSRNLVSVISADIREHEVVIFDFSGAVYLDDSAAMVIEQLLEVARNADTGVIVMGLSGRVAEIIDTLDILRAVPARQVVDGRVQARGIARELLGD